MPRKPKNHANRHISRIENQPQRGTKLIKGWEVRIYRGDVRFNKFFSDYVHGGKRKTLQVARELRDKMDFEIKPLSRREIASKVSTRNTSGHRGVRLRTTCITKGKKKYIYQHVEAAWTANDGTINKLVFSVAKMGLDKAWKAAIACRKKGIAGIK